MSFNAGQLPPDVLNAIQNGRTIDAIKRLRKATGLGLAEAKAVIDAHVRNQPPPLPTFSGTGSGAAKAPDGGRILPEAVLEALQRGDKNAAAQLLRERLGLSLKAAKKRLDSADTATGGPAAGSVFDRDGEGVPHLDHRITAPPPQVIKNRPGLAPGEVAHSNGSFWIVLVLVAVLIAYLAIF